MVSSCLHLLEIFIFRVRPYAKVDKSEYFTMSRHGVTYWSETESYFTELDAWMEEYDRYSRISKVRTLDSRTLTLMTQEVCLLVRKL